MSELFLYKRKVESVFQLLGEHENDLTCSVAWALAKSPSFLSQFIQDVLGFSVNTEDVLLRLQQHEEHGGITDIEIELPGVFFLVIEAKRGWNLPSLKQLETYACRRSFLARNNTTKRILPLSECSREYALHNLGCDKVKNIDIHPISWKDLAVLAAKAKRRASNAEKRLLGELVIYLRGLIAMKNNESNLVFVVSLGAGTPKGWSISWIDIVTKRSSYFHPVGKSWPKEPPNYIAFRYAGKLQSIHHIETAEVFTNPRTRFREIPDLNWDPHFLYKLGPAFAPHHEVKTGKLYPNGRYWCMLDTFFVCNTISDARDLSKKRISTEHC